VLPSPRESERTVEQTGAPLPDTYALVGREIELLEFFLTIVIRVKSSANRDARNAHHLPREPCVGGASYGHHITRCRRLRVSVLMVATSDTDSNLSCTQTRIDK
jgi:hypothetical protein